MMKKINWLLILQGWAMLWVVIGHSPLRMDDTMPLFVRFLYDVAYSFHMPLFIIISGYLFYMTRLSPNIQHQVGGGGRQWSYQAIILDKLKRLGIPFVVFTIIAMLMKSLFPGDMARPASFTLQEFFHAILFPREGPLLEMWFVAVILWMFALTPYWRICFKSRTLSILTLIILFALHSGVEYLPLGSFLCLKDTASFGVYFYIGMLVSKKGFSDDYTSYKYLIITLSAILYICFWVINFKFGLAMSGITFSVGIAFLLDRIYPKSFSSFRNYTYQIFLISIFIQIAVKILYKRVISSGLSLDYPTLVYVIFFLICLFMGLYIPVIISKISERMNWHPILLCLGLKKKQ